jgi:hypothetical protein
MAGYLGNIPSAVPLTSADIADGIITSAKIVDGTIVNADINASAAIASTKLSGISSDYVLLATTDVTSSTASVSFDGYFSSTYKTYQVLVSNWIPATNDVSLRIRIRRSNADVTSSNYRFSKVALSLGSDGTQGVTGHGQWNVDHINLTFYGAGDTTSYGGASVDVKIFNPLNSSSRKSLTANFHLPSRNDQATADYNILGASLYDNTDAWSGITFFANSGNIASGNFKLYGIK